MRNETYREIELAGRSVNWRILKMACVALLLIGTAAFLYSVFSGEATRAWSSYLVNYVYWTGLAFGTFLLSPILVATNATWGRPVKRLAESVVFFLPVSFLLFWPLFLAKETLFWWVQDPGSKAPWLNATFFFAREGIGILAMTFVALLFTYHSVKSDLDFLAGANPSDAHVNAQPRLSSAFIVLYAFILTVLAFDLIMSLSPEWYSTLFGAYYFVLCFYSGLALLSLLASLAVKHLAMGGVIQKRQFHDLGKLLFAFCVVCADFFYVQFLVIWYGNLPEETRYVLARVGVDPWAALAWIVLLALFAVPFIALIFRKIKMQPAPMSIICAWILIAAWLEKFLLVTPSVIRSESLPLGLMEILITAGWLGLFALCVCSFLERYPVLALSDPKLENAIKPEAEEAHV